MSIPCHNIRYTIQSTSRSWLNQASWEILHVDDYRIPSIHTIEWGTHHQVAIGTTMDFVIVFSVSGIPGKKNFTLPKTNNIAPEMGWSFPFETASWQVQFASIC